MFTDIFDELYYEFFKLSGGNPYIAQAWVQERNKVREKNAKNKGNERKL